MATDSSLRRRIINQIYKDEFLHNHTQPSQWILQCVLTPGFNYSSPKYSAFFKGTTRGFVNISQKQVEYSILIFNYVFTSIIITRLNIHNQK